MAKRRKIAVTAKVVILTAWGQLRERFGTAGVWRKRLREQDALARIGGSLEMAEGLQRWAGWCLPGVESFAFRSKQTYGVRRVQSRARSLGQARAVWLFYFFMLFPL